MGFPKIVIPAVVLIGFALAAPSAYADRREGGRDRSDRHADGGQSRSDNRAPSAQRAEPRAVPRGEAREDPRSVAPSRQVAPSVAPRAYPSPPNQGAYAHRP